MATAVAIFMAVIVASSVQADDIDDVRKLRDAKTILPLSQVLENIETTYPGTLLEVELEHEHGKYIYEIKILSRDHRIQHLKVDASSGRLLFGDGD